MDVTPLVKEGSRIIQSYSGGAFRISGEVYEGAVIVRQNAVTLWPAPDDFQKLSEPDFIAIEAMRAEEGLDVILFGCGARQQFLPPPLKTALRQKGLSFDMMDTGAACRTYNVLMAEGRRVAAILLPV
ncbi:MAG: Mth938-like domain-containing protein [Alphaproteobacteria bacterium]